MEKQPIYILPENVYRLIGKDAQRNNIMAARIVADMVKSTLGPKGMDKMLVDNLGDIIVTNDGVTILEEMQVEHPAAKMMVEIAKTQEAEVGDGTTTAVVLAGKLLENAEKLLDEKIHPSVIVRGYQKAQEKAEEILEKQLSVKITEKDREILKKIATTAMTGKGAETAREKLANIIVDAITSVIEKKDGKLFIDIDSIKLEKKKGYGIEDTELIKGIVLDKERVSENMPTYIKNAKIALIDCALEIKTPETDTKISITSPEQLQAFIEQEEKMLEDMAEKIIASGANVVLCQKGIDDLVQYYLARAGIMAVRRIKKSDMEKLAKATGAKIISNIKELKKEDLGYAGEVREVKEGDESMIYITGCKNPKAITILIRGGTEHVVSEIERAMKDGIGDVAAALEHGSIVAGGGAIEIELAKRIREYSTKFKGREQLAILAFAEALESIPRILAENAGLDPIEVLTELKAKHEKNPNVGLDLTKEENYIVDTLKQGIVEPTKIKLQAIKSATEVAMMILRIDDVISSSGTSTKEPSEKIEEPEEY
ncbi:MAG: thermosome subunit alpha [Candidatus Pacearchaeota archaeon]